jgi:diphthamide synthase (EF-2-diphthine--ammonia ligase)
VPKKEINSVTKTTNKKTWVSWSTGKDSAYALNELLKNKQFVVTKLLTTVTADFERVSLHSSRQSLLKMQADSLGLPLEMVKIPKDCSDTIYREEMLRLVIYI